MNPALVILLLGKRLFSPLSLFRSSEPGHWYDSTDLTTRYQESTGVTPAVVAQPEGFVGDKRLGFVRGPELFPQPAFDAATGLTLDANWTVGSGVATSAGGTGFITVATGLTIGQTYEGLLEVKSRTAGVVALPYDGAGANYLTVSTVGAHRRIFTALNTSLRIYSDAFAGTIDNASFKAIPGNHAIQATAAARPTLQQDAGGYYYDSHDGTQQHTTSTTGGGSTAGLMYCQAISPQGGAGTNRTIFDDGTYRVRINAQNKLELGSAKTVTYGANLETNGTFATDTVWTKGTGWTIAAGMATAAAASTAITEPVTVTAGKQIEVTYTVVTPTAGTVQLQLTGGTTVSGTARSTAGTFTETLGSVTGNTTVGFLGAGFTGSIDDVIIREKIAHHLVETAATVAVGAVAVATVWQEPRALVNLLTKTDQFDDAVWGKNLLTVTSNAAAAQDGAVTADLLIPGATTGTRYMFLSAPSGNSAWSMDFKNGGLQYVLFGNAFAATVLDLNTGLLSSSNVSGQLFTVAARANGFYRVTCVNPTATTYQLQVFVGVNAAGAGIATDGVSGVFAGGAQFEPGSVATTYQRVNTVADFDDRLICAQLGNGTIAQTASITPLAGGPGYAVGRDYATATSFFNGRLYSAVRVAADVTAAAREQVKTYNAVRAGVTL